jgi:hypothetical protein
MLPTSPPSTSTAAPAQPPTTTATPIPATATPTATVCLDALAKPQELPARQQPLEVQFLSEGNLWVWDETSATAQQISKTGDAQNFYFSPDGQVIVFYRGPRDQQAELWSIWRDGSHLQRLLSAEQLYNLLGDPPNLEHEFFDGTAFLGWEAGTHRLQIEVLRNYNAIGGCCDSGGYWLLDVDTSALTAWTPPPELASEQPRLPSPDGRRVVWFEPGFISVSERDGSNLQSHIFEFITGVQEDGAIIYPSIWWASDSQALRAITFDGDVYSADMPFSTWYIPLDGTPARKLHTFTAPDWWAMPSPNDQYLVYKTITRPMSNNYALHLATFDGTREVTFTAQSNLEFIAWHPDSYHFVYANWYEPRPILGSVCGGAVPLLDEADSPAILFEWVDAERFLYVRGDWNDWAGPYELRLGTIGGPVITLGLSYEDPAYFHYQFNREPAALGK